MEKLVFNAQILNHREKQEILNEIIVQLEKDTGFDYRMAEADAGSVEFLELMRRDLANYLAKISTYGKTRFMHLIYRVDINQTKFRELSDGDFYFHQLSELVLSRMFQKVITKRNIK